MHMPPHHLKAYIPRNLKIPQYSNDEYEPKSNVVESAKLILELDQLPDLPHVHEGIPGMSEDESVSTLSQMSACSIDSNGLNIRDRNIAEVLTSMGVSDSQESSMSCDISACFSVTIIEEKCTV